MPGEYPPSTVVCILLLSLASTLGCLQEKNTHGEDIKQIAPVLVTERVEDDSDDPAIWIHPDDPKQALILGTDKAGILFVFDLDGKIVKRVHDESMQRLNNIDVEYGLKLAGGETDIALVTDRDGGRIYAFSLPGFERIDDGNNEAFAGAGQQRPMGVGLYKRPDDGAVFAIVSRKEGPSGGYLWQYRLRDNGQGKITFEKVREFGQFSGVTEAGEGEIEAVCVDDELGFIFYSDELAGIRKYHADPAKEGADSELAIFGTDMFASDREGICIYPQGDGKGYIIVSDQQGQRFQVFSRSGTERNPHDHQYLGALTLSTNNSDGCEVTAVPLSERFSKGLFVAMSDDGTFHYYDYNEILPLIQQ